MKSRLRQNILVVSVILVAAGLAVLFRLLDIQIIRSDYYKNKATSSQWSDEVIPAVRGTIYDANGSILAESATTWKLYLIPEKFENENFRKAVCSDVARTLDLDYNELLEITAAEKTTDKDALVIAHKKDVKTQMELSEKQLVFCGEDNPEHCSCLMHKVYAEPHTDEKGRTYSTKYKYSSVMGLENDSKRYYPMGEFASSVIGTVNSSGNGVAGLERYYNEILAGSNGRKTSYGSNVDEKNETVYKAEDGTSLKLTIDETIQYTLDTNLREVYETSGGLGAYGIIMDVKTGKILAMDAIGYKGGYDLDNPTEINEYYQKKLDRTVKNEDYSLLEKYLKGSKDADKQLAEIKSVDNYEERIALHRKKLKNYFMLEQWNNYVCSETYHPGSVFKIFLTSAAIEENILPEDYSFYCGGSIAVDDRIFNCHSAGHGRQDLRKGLMNSCNPFFVKLGLTLGKEKFFEYFKAFGFTEKTGIECLEESNSIYFTADQLTNVSLASESFGQTFSVTPIQMITAVSCIANGGYLMQPYLVDEEIDADGNIISKTKPTVKRQVISEETAAEVASMMEDVCKNGTGRNGYVAGYRIAGKTGTTQKYQVRGTYIASFACFAPADDPEIAMLIICDEPLNDMNGSVVCAPAAAKIMEPVLEYLGVERQYTETELARLDITTPGVIGREISSAVALLQEKGFTVRTTGNGKTVISQSPAGGQTIPKGGVIALYTTDSKEDRLTVTVPNLTGMTANAVKKYAASEGLNVRISGGTGNNVISYEQSIEAGTKTEYGTIVTVHCKSYENVGDSTSE